MAENKNEIARSENTAITAKVLSQLRTAEENKTIIVPPNYSPENALKSAYLILQEVKTKDNRPALEACTTASITQALYDMVIQGLNPSKKQCYFIPYGNQLTLSRSYLGTIAVTKRMGNVKDVKGYPLYKGDKFETIFDLESGALKVKAFEPSFENIDANQLMGAFAVVIGETGIIHTEVMTMAQVRAAWNQGQTKGNSPAHKNFSEEMAVKSVINRACKRYFATSDDAYLLMTGDEETTRDVVNATYEAVVEEDRQPKQIVDASSLSIEQPSEAPKAVPQEPKPSKEEPPYEFNEEELPF